MAEGEVGEAEGGASLARHQRRASLPATRYLRMRLPCCVMIEIKDRDYSVG